MTLVKKKFLIAVLAAAFGFACNAAAPVSVGKRPISINDRPLTSAPKRPLKPVAEMSWTKFDGSVQKIKDFQGKVVVLDFWATYCPPCVEEIPHLMELKRRYGDDLIVVGLHVGGEEDRPKVPAFVEKLKIDYPIAEPEDELTSFVFGSDTAIPQTIILSKDGQLVNKFTGFDKDIKNELDKSVAEAINQN